MGLAEKRAAAAFEKDKFPALKKAIDDVLGYPIPLEVAWADIAKEGYQESYAVAFASNFFTPLAKALESICADDLGRNGFKEKVKKVTVTSTRPWSSLEVKLEGDVLNLDADPSYARDESCVDDYKDRIQKLLESSL